MDGLPCTPILFSLRRVSSEGSESEWVPRVRFHLRAERATVAESPKQIETPAVVLRQELPEVSVEAPAPLKREGRLGGVRIGNPLPVLRRYVRPAMTAAATVGILAGSLMFGRFLVRQFSAKHELIVTSTEEVLPTTKETSSPVVSAEPLAGEAAVPERLEGRSEKFARGLPARSPAVARDVRPVVFATRGRGIFEGGGGASGGERLQVYRRRVQRAYHQASPVRGEAQDTSIPSVR